MVPKNSVKMFASEISTDIKNTSIVNLVVQKFDFGGSTLGGPRGGGTLKLCRKICLLYLLISKKNWHPSLSETKINIWRIHFGGFPRGWYSQMMSKHSSFTYVVIFQEN